MPAFGLSNNNGIDGVVLLGRFDECMVKAVSIKSAPCITPQLVLQRSLPVMWRVTSEISIVVKLKIRSVGL